MLIELTPIEARFLASLVKGHLDEADADWPLTRELESVLERLSAEPVETAPPSTATESL